MKRPFSLLEVCIGLALTAILLSSLFSGFRYLMQTGAKTAELRSSLHPYFVMQMRMNQIFQSIPEDGLFYTDAHEKAKGMALYFIFQNGADPDPQFCGAVEGALYCNRDDELILELNDKRVETLLTKASPFTMAFFDPKEKAWVEKWKKDFLPPFFKVLIGKKEYSFLLPRANREADYT